ncbi:DUF2254 domain-containing protein [Adhaeretor mobilis]|uniref:DUF2254 domain-containing protein n=1 Tax=Adhaeretor mobilis TaxID=1930276 RepID=A0A517MWY3_9BACT|nr:DUF2254 domain-containing protein [Adhaeretor mobilis]QDS99388.1 hypothetical protein HG15A2_27110 [Adhaeretor mobilis]
MRAKFIQLLYEIRASYWFIPSLMALGAVALSILTTQLDARYGAEWFSNLGWAMASKPDGARSVLSTIAGSMITVAGVTFSMTMVSVSFASSQFGPRLIGNFMRDRGNQLTLGTFIATFVYCLMILRTIRGAGDVFQLGDGNNLEVFVPQVSMLIAIAFALTSVGVLIFFIHHIPETIDVSNITAQVGTELEEAIDSLFPDQIGQPADQSEEDRLAELPDNWQEESVSVKTGASGYVQAVDESGLIEVAKRHDLILRLQYRPGDFATEEKTLLEAYPAEKVNDEVASELKSLFAWGQERTPTQNATFLVDQLVEIIGRALSPGVNDPFTAISCLKWLRRSLTTLAHRVEPDPYRYDDEEQLRVVAHAASFNSFCSAVFDQTLQYVAADRNVALEAIQMIAEIAIDLPEGDRRETLAKYADALAKATDELLPLERDREQLKQQVDMFHRLLVDPELKEQVRDNLGWLGGRA